MKHKSAIIGFSYLCGLICASFLSEIYCYLICAALVVFALLVRLIKNGADERIVLFSLVFGAAFGVFGIYGQNIREPLYSLEGQVRQINGKVISKGAPENDMAAYIIETELDGINALVTMRGEDVDAQYGDILSFSAKFKTFRDNAVFSETSYYFSRGVFLKAEPVSAISVEKPLLRSPEYYVYEFNAHIKNRIKTLLPGDTSELLCGVLMGDKSGLSPEFRENIKRSGISHLMSVSGLHMTIISHIFMLMINLTPLKNKRKLKFIFLSVIILVLLFFFNLSPTVVRAGVMLLVYYGGSLFMRRGSTLNSLGFSLVLILLFSPYACLDIGLLFSLAGTFGIGVAAPAVNGKFRSERFKKIRETVIGTMCAVYCTFPLTAVFFKGVSIVSLITDIILQPFFFAALTAVTLFALTGGYFALPLFLAGIMSEIISEIIRFCGSFKYAYLQLDYDFIIPWAAVAFIFVLSVYLLTKSAGQAVKAGTVTVLTLVGMIASFNYISRDNIEIYVYSDGKSGVAAVKSRDNVIITATGDSRETASYADNFLKNTFIEKASILYLMNYSENAFPLFEKIPNGIFIEPFVNDSDDNYIESFEAGNLSLSIESIDEKNKKAVIDCGGYTIEIIDIAGIEKMAETAQISELSQVSETSNITDEKETGNSENNGFYKSEADLLVIYGYRKKHNFSSREIVFIDRKMKTENENERNSFYENVKIIFKNP